jgi:transcriptional regulator with XRE-family HTH domain
MAEIHKAFGERLKLLIKQEGFSQRDFALDTGMPLSTLATYCGGRVPDADILLSLAERFGVTVDFLLTGKSPWESGVYIDGKKVAEGTAEYYTLKELAEVPLEDLAKIKAMMNIIRGEAQEKKKTG